jgi:hypothetical protein
VVCEARSYTHCGGASTFRDERVARAVDLAYAAFAEFREDVMRPEIASEHAGL